MPRNGLPKYRRHPNGQAFVAHKSIDRPGNRLYLGKHNSPESITRYRQFLNDLAAAEPEQGRAALPPLRHDATIAELVQRYNRHAKDYYAANGTRNNEAEQMRLALDPLLELFADDRAAEFGPRKLKQVRDHMVAGGLARSTVNHRISRIKRFFRWAAEEELIPPAIYHGLVSVRGLSRGMSKARETAPVEPVPEPVMTRTLEWLSPQVAAMVQVQYYCGMRPQDVTIMRPCDIDRSGDVWLFHPHHHKNAWREQSLVKAVPKIARPILLPWLDRDPEAYCFSPREAMMAHRKIREERVNRANRPLRDHYSTDSYRRAIWYAITRANRANADDDDWEPIPNWSPIQLRHAILTWVSQRLGQQKAQRWAGHADLETTGIYVEAEVAELVAIASELDRLLPATE